MILKKLLKVIICLAITAGIVMLFFMLEIGDGSGRKNTSTEENRENSVYIYCLDNSSSLIKKYLYKSGSEAENCTIKEALECLKNNPKDLSCAPAVPLNVSINGYSFGEDGQLIIDFSEEYLELKSVEEVLARAAVVKTMCQLKGVSYVEFMVAGQPLVLNDEIPVGIMNDKMFVDTSGSVSDYDQQINITVYFAEENGKKLKPMQLIVESVGFKTSEEIVIEQLINGPIENSKGVLRTIPENTLLNKVKTTEGICFVDLSKDFMEDIAGISRNVKVYSVVNSLCELSNIKNVKISIDGEALESFRNFDFPEVMQARPDLISEEKGGV